MLAPTSTFSLALVCLIAVTASAETVRLEATADIWLSNANPHERASSMGKNPRLKLKTIQEMTAIRFDATPIRGREVRAARLVLRRAGDDMLRYIRVSTIGADWVEGESESAYGPPSGATYEYADADAKRPWAWEGSEFCDVIMGNGHTRSAWAERVEHEGGWISVDVPPMLVYALVTGDTDGLAVMDGGNLSYANNYLYSRESSEGTPYLEVELGGALTTVPKRPSVTVEAAPERAHLETGAVRIAIEPDPNVFRWKLSLDGAPVERWRVPQPNPNGPTVLVLDALEPSRRDELAVVGVSPGGFASPPTRLTVAASPALPRPVSLPPLQLPESNAAPPVVGGRMRVWALPPLVKIHPNTGKPITDEIDPTEDPRHANAVWDGERIGLLGAQGETVSFQIVVENLDPVPLDGIRIEPKPLKGPDGTLLDVENIELFKNWYVRNRDDVWQPAYAVPIASTTTLRIPDPARNLPAQRNQTVTIDLYIPKDAKPGRLTGEILVHADGLPSLSLPIDLTVFGFVLPDRLTFWPELNAYRIPKRAMSYYRLAHEHRAVFNPWRWAPRLEGSGASIRVLWEEYDRNVGPLLTGEAFRDSRRPGVPVEVMYLPFIDSWPTPLTKETYHYEGYWPGRGDPRETLIEHDMTAPYIGEALSRTYLDAFRAVERQFFEHFDAKGYTHTEMQFFFGGKATHRLNYGSNMWWTTDEPYHWNDWLALQFFTRLWTEGRGDADPRRWAARADISRPQWQDRILDGSVDVVYYGAGAFQSEPMYRRVRTLARETGLDPRTYGSANPDNESNYRTVVWTVGAWLNGANAVLPWQTLGDDEALDIGDRATSGNAILVPGERFGLDVVADLRLKAFREGQQLVEYLALFAKRYGLNREQVRAIVRERLSFEIGGRKVSGTDDADSLRAGSVRAWEIAALRRALAERIVSR